MKYTSFIRNTFYGIINSTHTLFSLNGLPLPRLSSMSFRYHLKVKSALAYMCLNLISLLDLVIYAILTITHIHTHTHTHTNIHTHIHIHTYTYIYIHTYTHTYTHTHTQTHIHIHTHKHTDIHPHTYTHIYTHIHTHTHTHETVIQQPLRTTICVKDW